MTKQEYDKQSVFIRRQIKKLSEQQKALDNKFISELPIKIGDEVSYRTLPVIVERIWINPQPPYKVMGRFRHLNSPYRVFELNLNNPHIRLKENI